MGHHITALITHVPIDTVQAAAFDLPVFIEQGYAIVALDPAHSDYWQKRIGLVDSIASEILLDCAVTHYIAQQIGAIRYAIIETDYFGGIGTQMAAVYADQRLVMPATYGGINAALQLLGVQSDSGIDEFDTINLGNYRDFTGYFARYYDENA